ncbi:glycoside hydrolase [Mycena galericulata]|nr:glycoside hydrolase [Mycena galericulata]
MHKITNKIATSLQKLQSPKAPSVPHVTHPPLETSIYRFRKQRGVNLGSWFVLERWITDAPFRHAAPPAQSDLDVAKGPNAASILEAHYAAWITDADFAWLAERGFTAVRIPIGYYHLCGADPSVLAGTDFAAFGDVFRGAWARIINAIETAQRFGLGVLLDLHAAPGKQNNDAHAGTSSPAAFFSDQRTPRAHDPCAPHARNTPQSPHPAPRQPHRDRAPQRAAPLLRTQTSRSGTPAATAALAALDPTLPIYLSDCWKTDEYAEYIKSAAVPHGRAAPGARPPPLPLLHPRRHRHAPPRRTRARSQTPARPPRASSRASRTRSTPQPSAQVLVVGEWSGALNPRSLTGAPDDADAKAFVAAQLQLYEAAHCAGHFFWTYKEGRRG